MMLDGIKTIAPTAAMLMFAILYFGIMIDSGLFDGVVRLVVRLVRGDPLRVVIGTASLATFVSLDGDGSTTYMITIAAMLPIFKRLRMNLLGLTCVTMLASGVMNLTPWGGPLARAATALRVDPTEVFLPLIPVMAAGIGAVLGVAYILGRRERTRLGVLHWPEHRIEDAAQPLKPSKFWFNLLLTVCLIVALISGAMPMAVLFMIGVGLALQVNFVHLAQQRDRIAAHAPNVLAVVAVIFAAGVFTGILSGTGMVLAMSKSLVAVLPPALGPYLAPITALASLPFTFFISNDAFYFGVLPVVTEAAMSYGIPAVEMARASLIGQPFHLLSPLVPSTYLLVGLAGVEFGDHQKFAWSWAALVCLAMLFAGLAFSAFQFTGVHN
jgi:citrate-Mg2+:H+ or citrate-Ca2+:H+ symporter, CitMHS family